MNIDYKRDCGNIDNCRDPVIMRDSIDNIKTRGKKREGKSATKTRTTSRLTRFRAGLKTLTTSGIQRFPARYGYS